ncbi:uncharacterized protein LOC120281051 [Dioscorea cayenensis subsp. rotundata]|uniref:Uncharacterized protein LOC120281051 n=1 Tax=Dioscorea cayennensis subsp. rotundata TaxID=55577 RepID=A0AB40CYJ7_DIOCR|nr:uncharacterized protein LOC120281051 [Dioscorea cayenensis subsp. rotundata]
MNGQAEVVNCSLGTLLRFLVGDHPKGWDMKLSQAEFAHNHAPNHSTGFSPFQGIHKIMFDNLTTANACYKQHADQHRRHIEFEVGDFVWTVMPKEQRFSVGDYNKLKAKKIGSVEIIEKLNPNAYQWQLKKASDWHSCADQQFQDYRCIISPLGSDEPHLKYIESVPAPNHTDVPPYFLIVVYL